MVALLILLLYSSVDLKSYLPTNSAKAKAASLPLGSIKACNTIKFK